MEKKFGSSNSGVSEYRSASSAEENDNVSAGFISGFAVAALAVGGGTYYFLIRDTGAPDFVSKADAICSKYWVSPGWNDEALTCYMVEHTDRLCDEREREHLVGKFELYRADAGKMQAKALGDVVANNGTMHAAIMDEVNNFEKNKFKVRKVEKRKPRKYGKTLSVEEKVDLLAQKTMNPDARNQNAELSDFLRPIFAKGFMKPYEFVQDAMSGVESPAKSPCTEP